MQHWAKSVLDDLLWAAENKSEETRKAVARISQAIETREVYLFRSEELEEVADGLSDCVDLEDLSDWMWKTTTSLHFQNFAVFVLKPGRGASFNPKICTSFNKAWIERYVAQGYQFVDPVMTRAAQSDGWFLYSEIEAISPEVQSFWEDAERHRIGRQGICCAITRSDGTRLGVSFSSQGSCEKVAETMRKNASDLDCIAHLAGEAFSYAASGPSLPDDTLTNAELRFLYVLSSSANPSEALKVSSCFGSNDALQSSIRRKLGVETVFQAVAIAASRGWFDLLPYSNDDIVKSFSPLQGIPTDSAQSAGFHERDDINDTGFLHRQD